MEKAHPPDMTHGATKRVVLSIFLCFFQTCQWNFSFSSLLSDFKVNLILLSPINLIKYCGSEVHFMRSPVWIWWYFSMLSQHGTVFWHRPQSPQCRSNVCPLFLFWGTKVVPKYKYVLKNSWWKLNFVAKYHYLTTISLKAYDFHSFIQSALLSNFFVLDAC